MSQGMIGGFKNFIADSVESIWGEKEFAEGMPPNIDWDNLPSAGIFECDSVCESAYGRRPGESVCDGRRAGEGYGSVYESGSVCEPAATAHYCRAQPASLNGPANGPYRPRVEDPIDVEIAEFFRQHPEAFRKNPGFARRGPGRYLLHGREISVERPVGRAVKGNLIVKDGPLTQQLADYLANEDSSAQYSGSVFQVKNALQSLPPDQRMTFCDTGAGYSRIEAMKVAKEQAIVREKAAAMANKGQGTGNLVANYQKTIEKKLGSDRTPTKNSFAFSLDGGTVKASPGFASPGGRVLNLSSVTMTPRALLTGTPRASPTTRAPTYVGGA